MNKNILIAVCALGFVNIAHAEIYKLDSTHTNATFNIDHFQTSTNHGGFYSISGEVKYLPEKQQGELQVTIPVKSLNTGLEAFDKHIRSSDILDAEKYPDIVFKSTKWNFSEGKPTSIEGMLTMKGVTKPVTLTTTKFGCYMSPVFNAQVCGGDFSAKIDRTQWGVDYLVNIGMSKTVDINIQAEAIRQ
ncbi:YceI family protein [Citrobacter sp. R-1.5.2]|uniref:YceI family protein n=1 Tax=Citrobacter sp. R-1.5.2 TaxID=3046183 RepID=UPI002B248F7B|nr:YceI family protein [Citrobacter sp. R-1.5.2]MEB2420062.1 YceI family protein [Citrobacter sp. R-1.5.2]